MLEYEELYIDGSYDLSIIIGLIDFKLALEPEGLYSNLYECYKRLDGPYACARA